MSNDKRFSDEHLNAYLDNQLEVEEASEVLKEVRVNPELGQQVCELRQVQELVRHAYREGIVPASKGSTLHRWPRHLQGMAALLLLAVGAIGGWLANGERDVVMEGIYLGAAQSRPQNVILHISTDDPIKLSDALDKAELMLSRHRAQGEPFRLEIVANDEGLNVVRARYSTDAERTEELLHNYNNLAIMACARTLQAIKEQGGDVELLPNVGTTESALERVVDRLQEGWLYVRV
ncbi:MAG TPA: hypothetical protein VGE50_05630 [Gammaproteobacteria bacterium]